ncbi:MAG: hypothetical protein OEZ01_07785, partial [Candidatus Heimdallarchaeota archaeon]|nr:hypothetical protein [Candidatus Heimdallarchaeota archaeon]
YYLEEVKPFLEFELHHYLAIEIIVNIVKYPGVSSIILVESLVDLVSNFIVNYELNQNSVLFQRANLYLMMLTMYKETGEFLRKEDERFVAFDPFSWIQLPRNHEQLLPYIPLNTSIDNLSAG